MAYTISFSDAINKGTITVEDNTVNSETSLKLPGKNTTSYGTVIAENFLHLLENFAKSSAPLRPIQGQTWFDTTAGVNQLKVYDGTNWVASGGLKKALNQPSASESITGDLWVDTDQQQLYLFTGTGWILVGPEYSQGLATGATPTTVVGTDDLQYTIIKLQVQAKTVGIIATDSFTPKVNISGFSNIYPGFNLSTANITGDGVGKFYGTAEKAEALVVGNSTVGAGNFLRSDTTSLTDFPIKVKTDDGIEVGAAGSFKMFVEQQAGIFQLGTLDEEIDFRLNKQGSISTILRISSQGQVGINNTAPTEALDIKGNILSSGSITANSTTDSTNISSGSIIAKGGLGVAKKLYVGTDANIGGNITAGDLIPNSNNTHSLGATNNQYVSVYANNFYGYLNGNISGTSSRSTEANKLTSSTTFAMSGDVNATSFSFDGQTGGTTKTFTTSISNSFIGNQTLTTTSQVSDELIINRTVGSTGIFKTTVGTIKNSIPTPPVASIMAYAGASEPTDWLFCDGKEVSRATYATLYSKIGTQYGTPSSSSVFKLPDLRGRFALGKDNMGGTSADRVTATAADNLGQGSGSNTKTIAKENLPNHEHTLRANNGDQFFATRNISGASTDPEVTTTSGPDLANVNGAQQLPNSGGIDGTIGQALDVMNPYLTINYIIYTGGTA